MKCVRHNKFLAATRRGSNAALTLAAALALSLPASTAFAQFDNTNWGSLTSPVFGSHEPSNGGIYNDAELFAGPNKFPGNYYNGVLPNGRKVTPAGQSTQIGMNPLGAAVTPDGKFLITTNDDERDGGVPSLITPGLVGGYSLTVIDTTQSPPKVVSQVTTQGKLFIGLQVTGSGPYTVYASGGGDNSIKLFTIANTGAITANGAITIAPFAHTGADGHVSNYTPGAPQTASTSTPTGYSNGGAKTTFPAGTALRGNYLYVACNGDNSLAIIDTTTNKVVKQVPVGYFPYAVSVSRDGNTVLVSNWGVTDYKFKNPTYNGAGKLVGLTAIPNNLPDGFYVPVTSTGGNNPQTSSISIVGVPGGNVANASLAGSLYEGKMLDDMSQVGDTHPSAQAIVRKGAIEVLYTVKSNSDAIALTLLNNFRKLPDFDLSPIQVNLNDAHPVHGSYPNAIVASPDNKRVYIAEAGINSVAVLDTTNPTNPKLLGRIPTGWYPTGLTISADGQTLYVVNAKGIGEDINANTNNGQGTNANPTATGLSSVAGLDSNYIFGSAQKIDLTQPIDNTTVLANNFAAHPNVDTSVVPVGGAASNKIKHVFFILHENKTFDSMLGNQSGHFGPYASLTYNNFAGTNYTNGQYTGVSLNTQALATTFATAVNYYSDSEESDAGHQFAASGTATDYTEKTLLVKTGRGLLVNKNFEPEDYPEGGYIFNNAARNGVSFKDYGALVRIVGTDTGSSVPTTVDDPQSGFLGLPTLKADNFSVTTPLVNTGDAADPNEINNPFAPNPPKTDAHTQGLGQTYFLALPILSILGGTNPNGVPHLDVNYPGYNFNISDQRRAREFIADFDAMVAQNKLPEFLYIYQPNDHTGGTQAPNTAGVTNTALQEVADGDTGLGMVVSHIMNSPVYYNAAQDNGSAIIITYDDAQSSLDHIHPHRTPLVVVSPYAKPGYLGKQHYSTASAVKTEELLLGLPPNNLGDLFATDLRDLFQPNYNGITFGNGVFAVNGVPTATGITRVAKYAPSPEARAIWALANQLDTSAPDRDSHRLGALHRLIVQADALYAAGAKKNHLNTSDYKYCQSKIYKTALAVVNGPARRDDDD